MCPSDPAPLAPSHVHQHLPPSAAASLPSAPRSAPTVCLPGGEMACPAHSGPCPSTSGSQPSAPAAHLSLRPVAGSDDADLLVVGAADRSRLQHSIHVHGLSSGSVEAGSALVGAAAGPAVPCLQSAVSAVPQVPPRADHHPPQRPLLPSAPCPGRSAAEPVTSRSAVVGAYPPPVQVDRHACHRSQGRSGLHPSQARHLSHPSSAQEEEVRHTACTPAQISPLPPGDHHAGAALRPSLARSGPHSLVSASGSRELAQGQNRRVVPTHDPAHSSEIHKSSQEHSHLSTWSSHSLSGSSTEVVAPAPALSPPLLFSAGAEYYRHPTSFRVSHPRHLPLAPVSGSRLDWQATFHLLEMVPIPFLVHYPHIHDHLRHAYRLCTDVSLLKQILELMSPPATEVPCI